MSTSSILIGADNLAVDLKEHLIECLLNRDFHVEDYGIQAGEKTDYPDVALRVATAVSSGFFSRGILLCGTGIGMSITANKVPGIRAAVCHDLYSAERSRLSNDCQILCMGAKIITPDFAESVLDVWLHGEFVNGSSTPKLRRIAEIEHSFSGGYDEPLLECFK